MVMKRGTSRRGILARGAALAAPLLAACGGQGGGQTRQGASPAVAPATIEFSFWGAPELVDTFNKDIQDFNNTTTKV